MDFPTKMYIDGALKSGAATREVVNPATETLVASVAVAGAQDAERALQAAKAVPRLGCNVNFRATGLDAQAAG